MSFNPTSPHISVLMSVYNGERYILRAIMSILAQTYADFELILIDDGSTDGTAELVNKIQDDRLKFYRQENAGLTKTLNKALSLAKGRLIARHDADDFSIVTRFKRQVDFLDKNSDVGLLGSSCFIQPERHGIVDEVYDYPEMHDDIVDAFAFYNPFVHGSMMIRRDLLEASGGYDEEYRYVQDYELWSRLLPETKAHNLSTPLYVRSVHAQTSQMGVDKQPIFDSIRARYVKKNSLNISDCYARREIQSCSLYPIVTIKGGWNRSLADTYFSMSRYFKQSGLPNMNMQGQAILHCPWAVLTLLMSFKQLEV